MSSTHTTHLHNLDHISLSLTPPTPALHNSDSLDSYPANTACQNMFSYSWIVTALVVLIVLVSIRRYQKSSSPPSQPCPPPLASPPGMPSELRILVNEFVASNTSMQERRVVSGDRLVAAYENTYAGQHFTKFVRALPTRIFKLIAINIWDQERRPVSYKKLIAAYGNLHTKGHEVKLLRTNLKWYLGRVPMPNILVPVVDVASILPLATAMHPLSKTSRQQYIEFQPFDKHRSGGEYLFILNNFDLKQMGIIAASIHALDTEARERDPPDILHFHMCFTFDNKAVSSAEKLCSWIEETNSVPLGLEYIAHKMTKIQVKIGLTSWQASRVYWMFRDLRRRRDESEIAARPIRFVNFLFQKKVKAHRPRGLRTWAPSDVVSWDAVARFSM